MNHIRGPLNTKGINVSDGNVLSDVVGCVRSNTSEALLSDSEALTSHIGGINGELLLNAEAEVRYGELSVVESIQVISVALAEIESLEIVHVVVVKVVEFLDSDNIALDWCTTIGCGLLPSDGHGASGLCTASEGLNLVGN